MSSVSHELISAARITVVFTTLYAATLANQPITKKRLLRKFQKEGKPFHRYTAPEMLNADRLVANLLEWSLVFLGPLWSLAATGQLTPFSVSIAWTYVVLRGFYGILVMTFGVNQHGLNFPLMASTFPAYGCLIYLYSQAFQQLF